MKIGVWTALAEKEKEGLLRVAGRDLDQVAKWTITWLFRTFDLELVLR